MGIPGNLSARVRALGALGAVSAAALLAGCAGGGSTAGASGTCLAAPGVTAKGVNVGLLYAASGVNSAAFAPYRAGVDARLGAVNAAGGVYGRTVSYQWADDAGQVAPNLSAAQQLVNTDHVLAIQEFSPSPQGSASWLHSQGVPVVGTSNNVVWTTFANMFSYINTLPGNAGGSITTWGDYARSQGAKRAAVLVSSLSNGSVSTGAQLSTSLEAAGIPTATIRAEPNVLDLGAVLRQIQSAGADFVTGVVDPTEFIEIAVAARSVNPRLKILSLVGYDPGIFSVGKQLAGMSVSLGYTPFERPVPAHTTFRDAMAQYAPQQQPATNEIALIGWVDADLMLRGLQAAGRCPTRASFITNLRNVTSYDADGLLPAPVNLRTVFGQLTTCYAFLKISPLGNSFVPVGDKPLCGSLIH